jgi:hypothetical protein
MGGVCAASPQMAVTPAPQWTTNVVACGMTSKPVSCSTNQVCAPHANMGAQLCVYQSGDVACPTAVYTNNRTVIGTMFADTRGCSACQCGTPTGKCSGGTVGLSSDPAACASPVGIPVPDTCSAANLPASSAYEVMLTQVPTGGGQCVASGGVAGGTVASANLVTICCM